jgi:hypothetical protein
MAAPVNMLAPDGSPVNTDPEHVDSLLADGYRLADDPGAPPAVAPPVDLPAPAARAVNLLAPDGSAVNADAEHVESLLADGYKLASDDDVRSQSEAEEYGDVGSQVAAGLEGVAQGATMGAYGAVGGLISDEYDAERRKREQYNPGTALAGNVVGAVAPALLSGGVGSAAALARMTPAGQLAALSTKMGSTLMARAGTSTAGRLGALVATGAVESAIDTTTRNVMDAVARGDVEISAERMMDGAWETAKAAALGGAIGGGLGGLVEGGAAVGRGLGKIVDKLPSVRDFANGRAFKAALGRSNIPLVRQAERYGGAEAIGETLNKFDVTSGAAGVETIAERTGELRDQIGKRIGELVDEVSAAGGAGPSRADLAQRMYTEIIDPLAKDAAKRPVARQLEGRVKDIIDDLTAPGEDAIGLAQLNSLRQSMGDMAAWSKRVPSESDEAYMDVYRLVSNYWADSAEKAAQAAGTPQLASELRQLKRDYSHIAFANDAAEDAVKAKLANRFASPSDYGVGAAAAIATGGTSLGAMASGMAGATLNKVVREHANSLVANTLYKLAQSGVKREKALEGAVSSAIKSLALPATTSLAPLAPRVSAPSVPMPQLQQMIQQAQELQDPDSPASAQLDAMTLQLAGESPEFADAIRQKVMQRASLIVQKLGPQTDPRDPLKSTPMPMDRVTKTRTDRFLQAAADPAAALERLSTGVGSPEDLEVVKALTPAIHQEFVSRVMGQITGKKLKISLKQKQKLHFALGVPVSRDQTPEMVKFYQGNVAGSPQPAPAEQQTAPQQDKAPHFNPKEFAVDNGAMARADSVMARGLNE